MADTDGSKAFLCDTSGCPKNGVHVCSGCRLTRYCCKTCQSVHWENGGHKYECKVSSETGRRAFANQDFILNKLPGDYYVFIPNRGGAHGLEFGYGIAKVVFRLFRLRALYSPYCVWRLYSMLKLAAEENCLSNLISNIREQIFAEYGVDPVKAKDYPQVGEVTEEDFMRIQASLDKGKEEARLLLAQPPPNDALQKQNNVLNSNFAALNGIQYMIFDPESRDVAMSSKKAVNIEIFKILRKRASISPRCLRVMTEIIENVVIDTQEDSAYKTRLKEVLRKQLQEEHGIDPCSAACRARGLASSYGVCNDVAHYATATMLMMSLE